jgi:hypothetical protein
MRVLLMVVPAAKRTSIRSDADRCDDVVSEDVHVNRLRRFEHADRERFKIVPSLSGDAYAAAASCRPDRSERRHQEAIVRTTSDRDWAHDGAVGCDDVASQRSARMAIRRSRAV